MSSASLQNVVLVVSCQKIVYVRIYGCPLLGIVTSNRDQVAGRSEHRRRTPRWTAAAHSRQAHQRPPRKRGHHFHNCAVSEGWWEALPLPKLREYFRKTRVRIIYHSIAYSGRCLCVDLNGHNCADRSAIAL